MRMRWILILGMAALPLAAQTSSEMARALDETRQQLNEQAALLKTLSHEVAEQRAELDRMKLRVTVTSEETAARLERAVLELGGTNGSEPFEQATQAPAAKSKAPTSPYEPPGELYFKLGHAKFTPGGWIDFTAYGRSTNVGSGLGTNFQSIPYNNTAAGALSEVRMSSQSSRISMRVDEGIGKVGAYGYLEADFNGYLPGNAYVSTNSNSLRMRVYYLNLTAGKWEFLGGQGWSLLTPTRKALSPFLADLFTTFHLDTNYQAGLVYARQTQFRFVYHATPQVALGLSAENAQQYTGSAVALPALFANTEVDINSSTGSGGATATPNLLPDVIAKATLDRSLHGLYWHMGVAGLMTSNKVVTPATVTKTVPTSDTRIGGGGIANVNLEMFKNFRLIATGYWSDGGGRYMAGMAPGLVVLQPGTATAPFKAALLHTGSGIGGFEWKIKQTTVAPYFSTIYIQRRYGLDPSVKTATYVGYGFPGSANTNNRTISEATFATTSTLWQKAPFGALQLITQSSWVNRAPWYVAPNAPKDAHTFMEYTSLRFILP